MFKSKNINLKLFGLALLTTVGLHNINQASAKLVKTEKSTTSYSYIYPSSGENQLNPINPTVKTQDGNTSFENFPRGKSNHNTQGEAILLASSGYGERSILDMDFLAIFSSDSETSRTKAIRTFSLYLFLLLFVPFGIFYPFFLFYRKLLNSNNFFSNALGSRNWLYNLRKASNSRNSIELEDRPALPPSITSFTAQSLKYENSTDDIHAMVSKLQIAFAVEDDSLRQKLVELCSNIDSRTDQGITELMRKTISLLISEQKCTHVSQSSESYPIDCLKTEFEAICTKEKNKVVSESYSVVGRDNNSSKSTSSFDNKDIAQYFVITLVLCTSHTEPIFEQITTKKQLEVELSELGKMRQDDLIKFDLLWNPQSEEQYLTSNELLVNYIDMIRLF